MTTITVKAQTHDGAETFSETSTEKTRHDMIASATQTLIARGGVIKCDETNLDTVKYLVVAGSGFAIQDNEQTWIE